MDQYRENEPYLQIITGPMASGKSSELIKILNTAALAKLKCVYLNSSVDTRGVEFSCHDPNVKIHESVVKMKIDTISDIFNKIKINDFQIIGVDEAQFFPDLPNILQIVNQNKFVVVAGLDSDFKQQEFGQIHKIIKDCNKHEKLNGFCAICSEEGNVCSAIYTIRREQSKNEEQILVGSEQYISVCRKHALQSSAEK